MRLAAIGTLIGCSFLMTWAQTVSLSLESQVPLANYGQVTSSNGSDIWTYVDADGHPYVLSCTNRGLAVFSVADPTNPVRIGEVPNAGNNTSLWQDVKVYTYPDGRAYAFLITQTFNSGVQVIDLNDLPNSVSLATTYTGINRSHNIFIHPSADKPYAYVCVTANGPSSGLHVLDISDPLNITEVSYWSEFSAHDIYVSDEWADPAYDGKDVAIIFTEESNVSIVDISDINNPTTITTTIYPQLTYSHSGWMDRTNRYLFGFDEGDEQSWRVNTTMYVWDLGQLNNPGLISSWVGPTAAIDHNGFVLGDYLYLGNYTRGFTLLDVHDPTAPVEVANYDTWPSSDNATFSGAWAAMPYLGNGLVAVNDFNSGLFMLRTNFTSDPSLTNEYYLPLNANDTAGSTRIRIINPNGATASFDMVPVNNDGIGTMRAHRRLPANGMLYQDIADLFDPAPAHFNWVKVASDMPLAVSLEGIGDDEAVAIPAATEAAASLAIPHIAADTSSFYTRSNIVNISDETVEMAITTSAGDNFPLSAGGPLSGEMADFETLFGGTITSTAANAEASANGQPSAALVGAEIFGGKQVAQLAGITLTDRTATELTFSHIANVGADWWTGMAIVNPDPNQAAQITISAIGTSGNVVGEESKELPAGGKLLDFVSENNRATGLISTGVPTDATWLRVTSDIPLTGYELFSDSQLRLFAGLQASTSTSTQMVLPFAGNTEWYSGVAVVNPTATAQNVTFTRYDTAGSEQGSITVNVAAGDRYINPGSALFGGYLEGEYWIRVTSDGDGIHGFVLYGPLSSAWLCGLNGIPY